MNDFLAIANWDSEFIGLDVDGCFERFLSVVFKAVQSFVPSRCSARSRSPWLRHFPSSLIRDKTRAWRHYKAIQRRFGRNSPQTPIAWHLFKELNLRFKREVHAAVCRYESSLLSHDPKLFHSYLRRKKIVKPSIRPLSVNGVWINIPSLLAKEFLNNFASVFVDGNFLNPDQYQHSPTVFRGTALRLRTFVSPFAPRRFRPAQALMGFRRRS